MRRCKGLLICLVELSLIGAQGLLAADAHLYRIDLQGKNSAAELVEAGIEVLTAIPNDHALAELTNEQMTRVIRMGYPVDYLAASLVAYAQSDQTDDYYNYTTLTAQLQAWADQNSDIAVLYDLGTTVQNRHVWGMKISDNPLLDEDEIVCYYVGCHHGNEDISAEVPMYFLGYIFDNYGVNPDVTFWVENREIWVLPLANPDGYVNNSRYNANDVDINRNYSFHWGESAYAYGPYPFSEVETQVIRDLNLAQDFTIGHSYHSYGEEILYPFAWTSNHPSPDNSFYVEITNAMAAVNGYDPMLSGNLYPHGGEHNDYLYAEQGVMSVTSEVWSGPGYNPPSSGILTVCLDNLPNDLYLLQRAGGAQITGRITDGASGEPLVAQYKIVQLWDPDEIYPRYSEPQFGRYRALVVPGTWTLEISKAGYATQTFPGTVVVAGQPTVIDVALSFVGYPDVSITMDPVNPPIVIPATGGTFQYDVHVNNNSGAAQVADVWIDVTLPSGSQYGPLVLRSNLNMSIGFAAYRQLTQSVPAGAPAGTYTMNAYVGDYDLNVPWSEDHFDFSKSGVSGTEMGYLPLSQGFDMGQENDLVATLPETFEASVYPNPFNPTTVLSFELREASYVKLDVFDVNGRNVGSGQARPLREGWMEAGRHEVRFEGSDLPSGIYIYRLTATGTSGSGATQTTISGKMVLMK